MMGVHSEVGRLRWWLRTSLNNQQLAPRLRALLACPTILREYLEDDALLASEDGGAQLLSLVANVETTARFALQLRASPAMLAPSRMRNSAHYSERSSVEVAIALLQRDTEHFNRRLAEGTASTSTTDTDLPVAAAAVAAANGGDVSSPQPSLRSCATDEDSDGQMRAYQEDAVALASMSPTLPKNGLPAGRWSGTSTWPGGGAHPPHHSPPGMFLPVVAMAGPPVAEPISGHDGVSLTPT
jgi:hypothetical protein